MKRLLLRSSVLPILSVLLYPFTLAGVCRATQGGGGAQATAKQDTQTIHLPVPIDLMKTGTIQFSIASPTAVEVGAKCDSEGNIYAVWSDSASVGDTTTASEPVRELAVKSKEILTFRTPPLDGYKRQFRWSFNLGPDGSLFILVRAQVEDQPTASGSPTYFVEKFKKDGSFDSRVQLDGPSGELFEPYNFAVFADGRFLILGTTRADAKTGNWRPFAGMFDSDGRFATKVEFAGAAGVTYPGVAQGGGDESNASGGSLLAVDLSSMTSDPDGDVYIRLAGSPMQVIVVSPSGEVEREIKLKAPVAGLTSAESGVAESGLMYVHFSRLNGAPPTVPAGMIGILNVNAGQYDRLYDLPTDANEQSLGVCGDSHGNFLFVESNPKSKLEVDKYSAN